jgi:DNA-binding NtrC family response regulator
MDKVLIAEDEPLMLGILSELLGKAGLEPIPAASAEQALQFFRTNEISAVITDIKMAGMSGLDLLAEIKKYDEEIPVIVLTAYSSIESAVAALRNGAYDYISKPFVNEDLLRRLKNAISSRRLKKENAELRLELSRHYSDREIIGKSEKIKAVIQRIQKIAQSDVTVLISGESGTGKELVARAIHYSSPRAGAPFLALNCGALPESLLESELFGHVRGAFTGATRDKPGLLQSANGGSVFLDEISEMTPNLQVKLLRAVQEYEVTPVGSAKAVRFNVRFIAATNLQLEKAISEGRFREDLFYRLNVVEIELPPLRERPEDIPLLVHHFLKRLEKSYSAAPKKVTDETMQFLINYNWPGNVRELENVIERAFILGSELITPDDLPKKITGSQTFASPQDGNDKDLSGNIINQRMLTLDELEKKHIYEVLTKTNNDKIEAARILGIDISTLYRKLKRYDSQ